MMPTQLAWSEANQRYLSAALSTVQAMLDAFVAHGPQAIAADEGVRAASSAWEQAAAQMPAPAALERLNTLFTLSAFERDVILLCAGLELDARCALRCAAAQGDGQRTYPTFSLAIVLFPSAHWTALSPAGSLRRWHLVGVEAGRTLVQSPLRLDERILHYLTGVQYLDERLLGLMEPFTSAAHAAPSTEQLAHKIATVWTQATPEADLPVVQLCGRDFTVKREIATRACEHLGLTLFTMPASALPVNPAELELMARLCQRELMLSHGALLLDCDELDPADGGRERIIARFAGLLPGPLLLSGQERRALRRLWLAFDAQRPARREQRQVWDATLKDVAGLNGQVDQLVAQFDLTPAMIQSAWVGTQSQLAQTQAAVSPTPEVIGAALWDACRAQVRARLDDLAQRIEPAATWDDLILPKTQKEILHEIVIHLRQRGQVYEGWDFASKGKRGLGICALFAGVSGTGKTMAAEVLAGTLALDLYHIDLSMVISKYVGETEKNLRRVFDAAEDSGAILLFDEADALFGRRSEVKDSHDRYANIEVSYLLQRMEAYRGLAILTTNMKETLDHAFLRRIRFIVQFPFPDAAQRSEIWRRVFPIATPTADLDLTQLGRLTVTGGNIRNIALHGAFLAADAGEPVCMVHLLQAARREYAKLERSLPVAEVQGWV